MAAADAMEDTLPVSRSGRGFGLLIALAIGTFLATILALGTGAVSMSPGEIIRILMETLGLMAPEGDRLNASVLLQVRLPRVVLALGAGAALGVGGAVLQGLFRNPLADPTLIGVSSGAGLAAVATIVLGGAMTGALGVFALPLSAFVGGVAATLVVYRIAGEGAGNTAMLLLAGIAVNAIAFSGVGVLTYLSDDTQLRELTFWTMGSVGGATWPVIWPAVLLIAIAGGFLLSVARPLNAYLLGEAEAAHLGIDVKRLKRVAILATALAVGAAVAVSGSIGFVGLIVPHLIRLIAGPDHRIVLPGAALLGAALLCGADILARTIVLPAELPIGLVTSLTGGPFFLWLLMRRQGLSR